jgi:hypothetical protein
MTEEVLTAGSLKIHVFWNVTQICGDVPKDLADNDPKEKAMHALETSL